MTGLIVKGIGGFYYIDTPSGLYEAKGRGALKSEGIKLAVGDIAEIEVIDEENKKAVINDILPRKNQFIRPPIVNVDTFIVVMAYTMPKPNLTLIDKFLVMAEMNNVEAIICINKCDLAEPEELEELKKVYDGIYPVVCLSAVEGEGVDELRTLISGKKAALAGPSGVGKSTIINALHPEAEMETGAISKKTSRGKHTTRHVEIFRIEGGGYLYDTPGFTSFEIMEADEDSLQHFYPDIEKFRGECYYDNCRHLKEPDCRVRQAVKNGEINRKRYESYKFNMEEIKSKKKY